jgi:hypothetical protein
LVFERPGDERRLRLEILPIAEDEACFMFQMLEGRLPVDRTLFPDHKDVDASIRLKVGAGAMATAVKDGQATVAWLRFIGTRKAEPAPAQDAKDAEQDQGGNGGPLALALALQVRQQVLEVPDVLDNLERFGGKDPQRMTRLRQLLAHAFQDANVRFSTVGDMAARKFAVTATPDVIRAVQDVVAQLRRQDLQELHLQCTQIVMPLPVAAAAGLATDKVVEVDETGAGKVIQDALAAKSTLRNLPDAGVLPLEPWVMSQPRREDATPRTEPEPFARPEVRVQALPLGADEAWFALQWRGERQTAIGAAPAEAAGAEPQFDTVIRLKVGNGVMVMSVQGEHAVVLWLRFCSTRAAEPAHARSSGKGG